jgi:integrase
MAREKRNPRAAGPRLERRGSAPHWTADLRPFGGRRYTILLDPSHPDWPRRGRTTADENEARLWSWQYVARVIGTEPFDRAPEKVPVAIAGPAWLTHRRATVARATVASSKQSMNKLRHWFGDKFLIGDITAQMLQERIDEMSELGYEPGTIHTNVQSMRVFFDWAAQAYCLRSNPVRSLVLPSWNQRDASYLSDSDLLRIRAAADELDRAWKRRPAHRLALELALNTGLRQQELFALCWEQIDEEICTCRVTHQLSKNSSWKLVPLKGKRARTVLVLPEWWHHHRPVAGPVLRGLRGPHLGASSQSSLINRLLDSAGLNAPGRGWHILRHTYARLFVERGGRFEELQRSLGHKSILTTEQTYGHFHEDRAAAAARERIYLVREGVREG